MRQSVCVLRVSLCVCVGEMCRQGLVSGLLSDSGVNNTLSLLCVCVCVCVCVCERESQRDSEQSEVLGRYRAGRLGG